MAFSIDPSFSGIDPSLIMTAPETRTSSSPINPQPQMSTLNVPTTPAGWGGSFGGFMQKFWPIIDEALAKFGNDPAVAIKESQQYGERQRLQRAAAQTDALSSFIAEAFSADDPKVAESAIKQISGLKGLEPEAYQGLQKLKLDMANKIRQDKDEAQMAQALAQADPETAQVVSPLIQSGFKPSQVMQLISSGLLGQKPQVKEVNGQLVWVNGTQLFRVKNKPDFEVLPGLPAKAGSPTFEKDLEAEADRRGLTGDARFTWKQQQRAEAQGMKSRAAGFQGALGREEAEMMLPIGENAAKWIDPDSGQRPDPGTIKGDLVKQKRFVPVTAQDLDSIKAARTAMNQLEEYRSLVSMYPKSTGNFAQDLVNVQVNKLSLQAKAAAGDVKARRLTALQATIPNLAKAMGDAGNVGERERLLSLAAALTTAETQESATAVLDQLERTLKRIMSSRGLRAPGGSSVTTVPGGGSYTTSKDAPTGKGW